MLGENFEENYKEWKDIIHWQQIFEEHTVGFLVVASGANNMTLVLWNLNHQFRKPETFVVVSDIFGIDFSDLRSYPIPFGLRIQRLVAQSAGVCAGCPEDLPLDAPCLFQATNWGDLWSEAKLLDVAVYLRGCMHLSTSARWKTTFPIRVSDL